MQKDSSLNGRLGIVVPTLGLRADFLEICVESLREIEAVVCFVAPEDWIPPMSCQDLSYFRLPDRGEGGAAKAINSGLKSLAKDHHCKFVTWIGDDDYLIASGFKQALEHIDRNDELMAVVGFCDYVDEDGNLLLRMQPKAWDVALLNCKGSKLPQPGSILRSEALERLGFLDESLTYAFDQDLFHKLRRLGKIGIFGERVSAWRWHSSSLSSTGRIAALKESHSLRMAYGNFFEQAAALLYLVAVRFLYSLDPLREPVPRKVRESTG